MVIRATKFRVVIGLVLAAVAVLALVIIAPRAAAPPDSRTELPSPSPLPTLSSSPIASVTTPSAAATPTQTVVPEIAAVWLLDTTLDRAIRLTETTGYLIHAGFDSTRPEIVIGAADPGPPEVRVLQRFDLDGKLVERGQWMDQVAGPRARCVEIRSVYLGPQAPGGLPSLVEVDGRPIEDASCGPISPDGRWMTYWIWSEATEAGSLPWAIDQWVIDLGSGERRLLKAGLVHCGGCDSVPGPKWSRSSRYFYFSDVVGGGDRFFLADVRTGSVRQVTEHVPREPFDVPDWSPVADVLLWSNGLGRTVMERMAEGTVSPLRDVAWPARFDPTGAYVYSPAWPNDARPARSTTVFELASARVVASLPGQPAQRTFIGIGGPPIDERAVVGVGGGFVAALQDAPGCAGTAIYRDGTLVTCLANSLRPRFSPDGTKLAVARATGDPVTREMCSACLVAEIVVIEVASGKEMGSAGKLVRVIMSFAHVTPPSDAVEYSWNATGTHLLVTGQAAS